MNRAALDQVAWPGLSMTAPPFTEKSLQAHFSSAGPSPANIPGEITHGNY